jgi:hypothetical protein
MFYSLTRRSAVLAIALISLLVPPSHSQTPKARPMARASRAAAGSRIRAAAEPAVEPARVILRDGLLTVDARNSDLNDILLQVANLTGMTISGLDGGRRIYGVYGPAEPRAVLTILLAASGYNFLMVGGDAVPRELLLTRQARVLPTVAHVQKPAQDDDYYADYAEQQDSADPY